MKRKQTKTEETHTSTPAKHSIMRRKEGKKPATQEHLSFREIRDDLIIMRDGTLRVVVLVSSINFALKSEDEQKAIIQGYVSFLNTLHFELQVVIQSRKLNIEKYLEQLSTMMYRQDNELLRKQIISYRAFVSKLVEEADIMDKKFFVVVPYSPYTGKRKNFLRRLRNIVSPAKNIKIDKEKMQQHLLELDRRIATVESGLRSIGLQTQRLDTQTLIELFYNTYNPTAQQQQRIENVHDMQVEWTLQ